MSQSFEEFLRNKHEISDSDQVFIWWFNQLSWEVFNRYAEEWSAQQPEDEVLESLKELYKYSCVAMDNHDHETQRAWKSTGYAEAARKAREILAKHKERR